MDAYRFLKLTGYSVLLFLFAFGYLAEDAYAQAESSLAFTIAPPLFQVALQPGESWSSEITVVNNNAYDITLYADPVRFKASDSGGTPVFVRSTEEEADFASTIVSWLSVHDGGFSIPREGTVTIPFHIRVPADAPPGGHYGALLIGNRPPASATEGSGVSVSSTIAALVLLRVSGDVREEGRLWQFTTEKYVYERPEARFTLAFKNTGNVHVQPQGNITVYNMFNKKRGAVSVNPDSGYGNVLPGSERTFTFLWTSDEGRWDIGKYRAEATVGYGYEEKRFAQATTYFWVIPFVPLAQILGGLLCMIVFFGWAVRRYVRRALELERTRLAKETETNIGVVETGDVPFPAPDTPKLTPHALVQPLREGIIDLRAEFTRKSAAEGANGTPEEGKEGAGHVAERTQDSSNDSPLFFARYKYVFLFAFACWIIGVALYAYFSDVLTNERVYTVVEEREAM